MKIHFHNFTRFQLESESSGKLEVLGQLLSECGICQAKDDAGTEKPATGIPDEGEPKKKKK